MLLSILTRLKSNINTVTFLDLQFQIQILTSEYLYDFDAANKVQLWLKIIRGELPFGVLNAFFHEKRKTD